MNKSESIKELATALAKAQPKIKGAIKDSANPFFSSKYADLASVVDAIRDPLSENGLSYVQLAQPTDKNEVRVETVLLHSSGEWISGVLNLPVGKMITDKKTGEEKMAQVDAQGYGSALTYARRYGLAAIVGVAPEDDDANAATGKTGKPPIQEPQRKAAAPKPAPAPANNNADLMDDDIPFGDQFEQEPGDDDFRVSAAPEAVKPATTKSGHHVKGTASDPQRNKVRAMGKAAGMSSQQTEEWVIRETGGKAIPELDWQDVKILFDKLEKLGRKAV